jgi:glycosyltransferase involved in cell wall biosynthesis
MRVLHIDSGREMRGGQWQVLRLLEGMAAAGHEPVLLAPRISPLFRKAAEQSLPAQPLKPSALVRLSASADLVHAHDARSHSLAALLRAPLAVARRVAFPIRRTPASRWKYARADHYIAVSQYVKRVLVGAGISSQKISVVYDGVPLPVAAASGRLIVAPSTADPAKGTHVLREAATLAGVSLHFSENLEEDLTQARLFVYITHQEGLGSAALLAMATGVPVVASRVGGLPEIIEDGQTGLLAENTPEAIASAMRRLLGDGTLRATLATRARETVRERFSVSAMVRDTLNVYERMLSC